MPPWAGKEHAFVDIDVSGRKTKFQDRPEGRRLLRRIARGDHLFVWRIDRLGRRIFDIMETAGKFVEKLGVKLHVANLQGQMMDLSSVAGKCVLMGLALAAEIEGEAISERVRASHAYRKRMGRQTCVAPPSGLGWKWERINGQRVEVPYPEQRYALLQIHALRRMGLPWTEVTRRMNDAGILNGSIRWTMHNIRKKYIKFIKQVTGQEECLTGGVWTVKVDTMPIEMPPELSTAGWLVAPKYAERVETRDTSGVLREWREIDGRPRLVRIENQPPEDGDIPYCEIIEE